MKENISLPRWGQWACGVTLIAVAVTAGCVSLTLNVLHGLEAGLATAIAFGLADVGKICIPLVAAAIGWSMQTRLTLLACATASVLAASSYYLDQSARQLFGQEHGATVAADRAKSITELEQEVARANRLADEEAARKGCGEKCAAYRRQAEEASQRLRGVREARAATPIAAPSGLAGLAASVASTDESRAGRWLMGLKVLLAIILLESLVYLSITGGQMIGMAIKAPSDALKPGNPSMDGNPSTRPRDSRGRFQKKEPFKLYAVG